MRFLKSNIILLILFFNSILYSQEYGWYQPSTYPTGLTNLNFINANTGWSIGGSKVYKTNDGGIIWERLDSLPAGLRSVVFINETTGWIGCLTPSLVLLNTTNGGYNWSLENLPDPVPQGLCGMHALNDSFIYACGRYDRNASFIKSTNGGVNWITKDMTMYSKGLVDCHFFDENRGIVVGCEGGVFPNLVPKILMTTDGGECWETKYTGTRNSEWCWKISFVDENHGFVSLETFNAAKFFLKTSDGGMTWSDHSYVNSHELGIGFINTTTGWIGGGHRGFETTDGGITWTDANIGQLINRFQMFGDTLGYACGEYIYKYGKTTGISTVNSSVPENYYLLQNYPNPYNSSTKIKFGISKKSNVKISVYDIQGKHILTILNEMLSPGNYEIPLNTTTLSTGVYYYSLELDFAREIKKMVLLK